MKEELVKKWSEVASLSRARLFATPLVKAELILYALRLREEGSLFPSPFFHYKL